MGFFDLSFSSEFLKCTGKEVMGCKGDIFLFAGYKGYYEVLQGIQ